VFRREASSFKLARAPTESELTEDPHWLWEVTHIHIPQLLGFVVSFAWRIS